ncbi:hypothetical protein SH1V18_32390 [Vallitalea longa]|uniref:DUF5050 domain-containing protein n=1 Tax=Vallitalea longa TaxID=2936439 RepID=A0A9W5YF19_9FIRM|nr:hypothetical protein [Vallitalea longa]GKX30759.1 hypothetical protein SH1V18_32390 [Vallitalea longa]
MKYKLSYIIFLILIIFTGCSKDTPDNNVVIADNSKEDNNQAESIDKEKTLDNIEKEVQEEIDESLGYSIYFNNDDKSLSVEGRQIADYLVDDDYIYLMLVDDCECANTVQLVKYDMPKQKFTQLYKKDHITPMNEFSIFIRKFNKEYISLNLSDEIIVFDVNKNIVSNDIIIPEDIMYPDLCYDGDKLCYYKNNNIYISKIDFSQEKLLKSNVEDTEDGVQPKWSHDGKKISCFNGYNIEIINLHGKVIESIPRYGRYNKWSDDDESIFIGTLGFFFKINFVDKVIIATCDNGYQEYSDKGYDISILDVTSPHVVYESINGILAYMMYPNNIGCSKFTDSFTLDFKGVAKNIRWTDKDNELAINHTDSENNRDTVSFVTVDSNNLIDKNALKDKLLKENYYLDDNKVIRDNGEWIITSGYDDSIENINLSTGEKIEIDKKVRTQTQPLKKWNYIWNYKGIYLINQDGSKKMTVVDAGENYINGYFPTNDKGLVYKYRESVYFYNYVTMENKRIIEKDVNIDSTYYWNNHIYVVGTYENEEDTLIFDYDLDKDIYNSFLKESSKHECKGLINDNLYFDGWKYNIVSHKIESSCELKYDIVEWKDKLYFKSFGEGVVGNSEDSIENINFYNNNYSTHGLFWYFGDKLYFEDYNEYIYIVNPDNLDVVDSVKIYTKENEYDNNLGSEMYLVNNELMFSKYGENYKLNRNQENKASIVKIEPFIDSLNTERTLFLNKKNKFENMDKHNEIANIINEAYNDYDYSEKYIVYTDKKNKVHVINRITNDNKIVGDITSDRVEINDNNIYISNKSKGIFRYNIKTDKINKIIDGYIYKYQVIGSYIYYIDDYLDRNLYKLNIDDGNKTQITDDDTIVEDIFLVNDEVYYLVNKNGPVLYKIVGNSSEYIKLIDVASVDRIFQLNDHEICFIHEMPGDSFIIDTIPIDKGQIPEEIIYEDDKLIIFDTYLRCYEYGDFICGIYNKHNNKLEKTFRAFGLINSFAQDKWVYLIEDDYEDIVIERININSYEVEEVLRIWGEDIIISPDNKYIVIKQYDSEKCIFLNVDANQSKEINLNSTDLKYIKDGYIYYDYEGKEFKYNIGKLDE